MPLLDREEAIGLLGKARIQGPCMNCGKPTALDYCRTCDEFYWICDGLCNRFADQHYGHRLTIVPFVEE